MKIVGGVPVGGVALSGVYVGAQRLKDGGTVTADGDRVYYQSPIGTVRSCRLDGANDALVLDQGASLIVAGGGCWAIWLAGRGVVTSWGLTLPAAAVLAMTEQGDLLVLSSYATGSGLALYLSGMTTPAWTESGAQTLIRYPYPQAYALHAGQVVWADAAGRLFAHGLPSPQQVMPAFDPFLVDTTSVPWVGYHTNDGRLLLHPIDNASKGYVLVTGETFGTTATGDIVGYSRDAGESQMVALAIDWTQPTVPLITAPPLPPPVPPLKKPEVTVTNWTLNEMKNGREFVFIDRENPGFSAKVWTENGSMYASFTNPAGTGRTGAARRITECSSVEPPPGMTFAQAQALVVAAYGDLLYRAPDAYGLDYYRSRLMDGRMTDATMRADIMASDEYASLHPPTPVPGVLPMLSIVGREFRDRGVLWIPRFVSGLTLLVRTPAEQEAFLDWALRSGFNGVRVFAGALSSWAAQTPEGARASLEPLLDRCAVRGLACEVTAITDSATGYDARAHLAAIVSIVGSRRSVLLELANEVGHPTQAASLTPDVLRSWGTELCDGMLWAIGAAQVDEPDASGNYPTSGGSYSTAHLDRGRPRWDNVRRVREIYAIADVTGRPALDNEPMGADEMDGSATGRQRWNDPALFGALGALDRLFGVGGVHHSQAGRMATLPGQVQQACADAYVKCGRAVDRAMGPVVGTYKNVGHADGPLVNVPYGDQPGAKATRLYASVNGSVGALVIVGNAGTSLNWANGWRLLRVLESLTGQDGRTLDVLSITR